ncbi:MAG: serine O-acetyltransferase [Succinivibrionaceae bacterium]|nr:serine O-acetyltransferase [Ruminobacter sp.]MDY3108453.1 serine O-acetyltransferase [Succinivibrio sp.]MDY5779329.1 serine O-acetyltransferase [Succinivibrionaceae bacterium]MEE1339580.1 serine O-acetyltransferase [Succinivibrionaceae bacterium]
MIVDSIWNKIREEAKNMKEREPMLGSFFLQAILNQKDFVHSLSFHLANRLSSPVMPSIVLREIFIDVLANDDKLVESAAIDLKAVVDRDPAVIFYVTPLLYLKGYQAIEAYRIAHVLWEQDRKELAYFLQNQISVTFGVDIHPAAKMGSGIMFDHATGIVIGETAVIGDNVSMLHNVTLGGTGHEQGQRHPKIGSGVMIGAGSSILGNITVGDGAKIGAGSVVLHDVERHTTVAGVPAKVVGKCLSSLPPSEEMDQYI